MLCGRLIALSSRAGVPEVANEAAFVILLLVGAAYGRSTSHSTMDLLVKWGRERISLNFPDPNTTLGKLKEELSEKTGLEVNQFKLVHAGAVLKNNIATLSSYGLKPGSKLTLIGSATAPPTARDAAASAKASLPRTQEGVLITIKTELENVHQKIAPSLDAFINTVSPQGAQEPRSVESNMEDLQQEHTRLGELLLQSLLRLDAITPESDWEDARAARKAAVKEVQADLDKLDVSWKAARANGISNGSANGTATATTASSGSSKAKSKRRR
ncbi:hypothetical protein CPB86DRAFT_773843 [Serendipita vermifera]|nr:hypothetical protein CPB86DRAFT_773843 [Serendipita vermifera]